MYMLFKQICIFVFSLYLFCKHGILYSYTNFIWSVSVVNHSIWEPENLKAKHSG